MDSPIDQLVEQYKATGDSAFLDPPFREYRPAVFSRCLAMLRNRAAADDVTHETFVAAQQFIAQYGGGSLLAWLLTIARRRCLNHLKAGFREPFPADPWDEPMHAPEFIEDADWLDRLGEVLRQLSPPQRICFKLFHIDGYTYKEIAAQTDFSLKEVKTHIQNGQRRFRILWGKP